MSDASDAARSRLVAMGFVCIIAYGWLFYSSVHGETTRLVRALLISLAMGMLLGGFGLMYWGAFRGPSHFLRFTPLVAALLALSLWLVVLQQPDSWGAVNTGLLSSAFLALVAAEAGARSQKAQRRTRRRP